jgi:hypothetical protein
VSKNLVSEWCGLPVKTINILRNAGFDGIDDVRAAILRGDLSNGVYKGKKLKNFGAKTWIDICLYFGLTPENSAVDINRIGIAIRFLERHGYVVHEG